MFGKSSGGHLVRSKEPIAAMNYYSERCSKRRRGGETGREVDSGRALGRLLYRQEPVGPGWEPGVHEKAGLKTYMKLAMRDGHDLEEAVPGPRGLTAF